jgi:hypothetical protein
MKCVITGEETNMLSMNIPLSRTGRSELVRITDKYNEKLKERFLDSFKEKSGNFNEDTLEAVERLAPTFSKKKVLRMLEVESEEKLFSRFEKPAPASIETPDTEVFDEE